MQMKMILVLFFCCLFQIYGESGQGQKLAETKLVVTPKPVKEEKLPKRDPANVRQYDYETYCKAHFYFFDYPERMVKYYPDLFSGMKIDVAMGVVQRKMLQNLLIAGCVW